MSSSPTPRAVYPGARLSPIQADETLRVRSVPFVGLLGQTVADVGVAPSVALLVGLIAAVSGTGDWLSWACTIPVFFAAAYAFSTLARRYSTTGGLPSLIARVASSGYGLAVGTLILLTALSYLPFQDVAFAVYFRDLLNMFSVHGNTWIFAVAGILGTVGAAYVSYRDVGLAARVLVAAEVAASSLILLLMVIILVKHKGGVIDHQQLGLHGVSAHAIVLGAVVSSLTFTSFECTTTFGQEASRPKRNIPLSLYGVLAYGALFLIFTSYVMTLGFEGHGKTTLAGSANPLVELTTLYNVHWLSYPLEISIVVAIWAVLVALINWTARMLFTHGREGVLHHSLGVADPRRKTPRNAVILILAITVVIYFLMLALGRVNLTQFGYIASSVTLFYLAAYIMAGVVIFVLGTRQGHIGLMLTAAITAAGFGYITWNTLRPAPAYPQNIYDYVVLGVTSMVIVGGVVLWALRPVRLRRFGSSVDADTFLADEIEPGHQGHEGLAATSV
jgi:amino acid transporter